MPFTQTFQSGYDTDLQTDDKTLIHHQKPSNFDTMTPVQGMPFVLKSTGTASETIFDAASPAMEIIDCWGVMTGAGGASDTFKLTDGTNDITDAVDLSSAGDTDRLSVGEIDDAYSTLAEGDTLTVARASSAPVDVYILAVFV